MKTYPEWEDTLFPTSELFNASIYPFNDPEALEAKIQAELEELLERVLAEERKAQEELNFIPELINPSLDYLAQRYAGRTKLADEFEAVIYSDIHSYDLLSMGIQTTAVVDFIKLEFIPQPGTDRSQIKKYLTEKTGVRHYIEESNIEIAEFGRKYSIKVHDLKSVAQLERVIEQLEHFGVNRQFLEIIEIELSLDFYNAPRKELLIALFKSLKLSKNTSDVRFYRYKGEVRKVPLNLLKTQQYLEKFYCIGINPQNSDLYYRLYRKVTDRMSPLSPEDHRLRLEVNLSRKELIKITLDLLDIETLIREGFKHIDFTRLSEDAGELLEMEYRQHVQLYGQEVTSFRSKSGNRRTLQEGIKLNAELNKMKRIAVSNLVRNFKRAE